MTTQDELKIKAYELALREWEIDVPTPPEATVQLTAIRIFDWIVGPDPRLPSK
jgi:hypothetical protein